jgi:RNA polymerase sigma-70 factor (TIGR02960 family)
MTMMAALTDATLARARAGDEQAFRELTDPYRRELQLHCYRMLGSLQDAEDLLQETLLAAWRGLDGYEARAPLRTWLYRIATNRCLNALRAGARRPRTTPWDKSRELPEPTGSIEPVWLDPYPDALLEGLVDRAAGPEARYETREAVGLAFVTALQHLPARQRAVLVLRDVMGFRSGEVASMLRASEASVNSALQRARSGLDSRLPAGALEHAPLPRSAREREVAARFADAFESGDVERVLRLLTDDAALTMPPEPLEYRGRLAICDFFTRMDSLLGVHLVATRANGQPAFGYYAEDPGGKACGGYALLVLTFAGERVAAITAFSAATGILPRFGLPPTLVTDEFPRRGVSKCI